MTWEAQNSEQAKIVATEKELTVVLGGAGVGKTTSALAAAAAHLERVRDSKRHEKVLFLSFSRASVARISSRASAVVGRHAGRIDVMTFHSLAFSVVRRFGSLVGHGDAVLVSPAREKLGLAPRDRIRAVDPTSAGDRASIASGRGASSVAVGSCNRG